MATRSPPVLLAVGASILAALVTGCPTSRCSTGGLLMRELLMWVCALAHVAKVQKSILRKEPTFRDATTGFPAKWRLRKFHADDVHNQDLGSASDWLKQISLDTWILRRRLYGISAVVVQTSFRGENSVSVAKCRLFSQVNKSDIRMRRDALNENETRLLEKCT